MGHIVSWTTTKNKQHTNPTCLNHSLLDRLRPPRPSLPPSAGREQEGHPLHCHRHLRQLRRLRVDARLRPPAAGHHDQGVPGGDKRVPEGEIP